MPHWVTFDHTTSAALSSRLPEEAVVHLPSHDPLEHALANKEAVVAVMPSEGNQTAVAIFRWQRVHVRDDAHARPVSTRGTGMLGLGDELVLEEEPAQDKRGWWARFWNL